MELISLLSKYSVDCIATALFSCFAILAVKKRFKLPEKANRLLPFGFSFAVYALASILNMISVSEVVSKSMTAGGLSTVLYAFCGGYSLTKEEELKKLMSTLLKTVIADEQVSKITNEILSDLKSEEDEFLITVKISTLIKANVTPDVSEEQIRAITSVFIQTYREFSYK